jgi:hypothetical protein
MPTASTLTTQGKPVATLINSFQSQNRGQAATD